MTVDNRSIDLTRKGEKQSGFCLFTCCLPKAKEAENEEETTTEEGEANEETMPTEEITIEGMIIKDNTTIEDKSRTEDNSSNEEATKCVEVDMKNPTEFEGKQATGDESRTEDNTSNEETTKNVEVDVKRPMEYDIPDLGDAESLTTSKGLHPSSKVQEVTHELALVMMFWRFLMALAFLNQSQESSKRKLEAESKEDHWSVPSVEEKEEVQDEAIPELD